MVADPFTCMDLPGPMAGATREDSDPADVTQLQAFAEAIERQDVARAQRLCARWQGGRSAGVGDAYFGLVLPTIRQLERRWQDDSISYDRIVQAFLTLHRVLRSSIERSRPAAPGPGSKGHACFTLVDGAAHDFGLLIVADAFQADGWRVSLHLADANDELMRTLRHSRVDLLGIGVGNDRELAQVARLADTARRLSRQPALKVIVGGCVIAPPREQYSFLGVDHIAYDAQDALAYAEAVCRRAPGSGQEEHA